MNITEIGSNRKHDEFYKFYSNGKTDSSAIIYILKSPALFYINNEYSKKYKSSFIIINSDTPYSIHATGETLVYDRLCIKHKNPSELLISYNICANTLYSLSSFEKTDYIINIMLNEYYSLHPHKNELMEKLISALICLLGEEVKNESYASKSPYYDKLLEIRKNIHSMPSEKWTVDSICKQVNLSRSYFQLLYREAFGITCINDVIECKVNLACRLLETTTATVSNIARQCGYDSDVHFMRQFKKLTGFTPSEYRKKNMPVLK